MSVDDGLRPLFRKHLPKFFWTSIETGGTGLGVPDSHYLSSDGIEGMIEFKATSGHAVVVRPEQASYLMRRARCCGRTWIAVRRRHAGGPRRGPPVDELVLLPGALAAELRAGGLRSPAVAVASCAWRGGPARWFWDEIEAVLLDSNRGKVVRYL